MGENLQSVSSSTSYAGLTTWRRTQSRTEEHKCSVVCLTRGITILPHCVAFWNLTKNNVQQAILSCVSVCLPFSVLVCSVHFILPSFLIRTNALAPLAEVYVCLCPTLFVYSNHVWVFEFSAAGFDEPSTTTKHFIFSTIYCRNVLKAYLGVPLAVCKTLCIQVGLPCLKTSMVIFCQGLTRQKMDRTF